MCTGWRQGNILKIKSWGFLIKGTKMWEWIGDSFPGQRIYPRRDPKGLTKGSPSVALGILKKANISVSGRKWLSCPRRWCNRRKQKVKGSGHAEMDILRKVGRPIRDVVQGSEDSPFTQTMGWEGHQPSSAEHGWQRKIAEALDDGAPK